MKTNLTRRRRARANREPYTCPLASAEHVVGCGGKAVNLGRMLRLGLPVPPGVVVTDRAFREFLDLNRLHGPIASLRAEAKVRDPESLRRAAQAIREQVTQAAVPPRVWQEVSGEVRRGRPLVVRSSAIGEDSAHASFAGQLDSFLNVDSEQGLHDALLACWASYWSERSLFYQLSRGIRLKGMGVIIQEQVAARVSGVLFTRAPDQGDALLVEYGAGTGEALVSGRINPGRIVISRDDLRCERLAEAETSEVTLSDPQLRELASAGLALEDAFGGPQDVEWAIADDGRLFLVQSRPITVAASHPADGGERVLWSNANVNENFPEPISPLLYSIAAEGYEHYFRNLGVAFGIAPERIRAMEHPLRHLIGVHGARMYYNLTNIHAVLRQAPFGDLLTEFFNSFVGAGQTPRAHEPAVRRSFLGQCVEVGRIACRAVGLFFTLPRRVREFEKAADAFAAATVPDDLDSRSLPELLAHLRGFLDIRFHRWLNASLADAAAMLSYGALKRVLRREFPAADLAALHNTLLKGLRDVVSSEPVADLWELSRIVRADPRLREVFAIHDDAAVLGAIRERLEFTGFRAAFEAYLQAWGFRCSGELMLTVASFQEAPARLVQVIRAYAALEGESPLDVLRRQEAERSAETGRVLAELRDRKLLPPLPWPTRAALVQRLLAWAQRSIGLRERARLKQALLYSRCRRIVLAIGKRLAERGCLEAREDVFFLTHAELDALLSGSAMFPDSVAELVRLRKMAHARLGAMKPPDAFELAEGAYLSPPGEPGALAPGGNGVSCGRAASSGGSRPRLAEAELSGLGACGGQATGPAAVLGDVTEFGKLSPGDVLVTRQTDPGWGPVFFLIKGLVMERGGMLSHGAILAREYGIPTVVGVADATRRIAPGQTVSVNGDRGVVHLDG
jgi:pyruvate,water dikinase